MRGDDVVLPLLVASVLQVAQPPAAAQRRDSGAFVGEKPAPSRVVYGRRRTTSPRALRRPDYIDGATLNEKFRWLRPGRGGLGGETLLTSDDQQTTYLLIRRTTPSLPEVHARWDDIVIVRGGGGVLALGDSLVGSAFVAPGERRGGTFVHPYQIVLKAGDIVRVPAAVPHAFVVEKGRTLEYVMIRQRRQRLPVRWAGAGDSAAAKPPARR